MSQAVRQTRYGNTVLEIQHGEDAGAPGLDAIERMYEEATACIAEATGWPAPDTTDPRPETEVIDVRALKAPAAAGWPIRRRTRHRLLEELERQRVSLRRIAWRGG